MRRKSRAPKGKRVQVSLREDTYETIRDAAEVQGVTMSALISDWMEVAAPGLHRLAKFGRRVEELVGEEKESMRMGIELAEIRMEPIVEAMTGMVDDFAELAEFRKASKERPPRAAEGVASESSEPPASNTGAKFGK